MDTQDHHVNALEAKSGMLRVHPVRHQETLQLLLLDQVDMKIIDIKLILAMLIKHY